MSKVSEGGVSADGSSRPLGVSNATPLRLTTHRNDPRISSAPQCLGDAVNRQVARQVLLA